MNPSNINRTTSGLSTLIQRGIQAVKNAGRSLAAHINSIRNSHHKTQVNTSDIAKENQPGTTKSVGKNITSVSPTSLSCPNPNEHTDIAAPSNLLIYDIPNNARSVYMSMRDNNLSRLSSEQKIDNNEHIYESMDGSEHIYESIDVFDNLPPLTQGESFDNARMSIGRSSSSDTIYDVPKGQSSSSDAIYDVPKGWHSVSDSVYDIPKGWHSASDSVDDTSKGKLSTEQKINDSKNTDKLDNLSEEPSDNARINTEQSSSSDGIYDVPKGWGSPLNDLYDVPRKWK